MYVTWYDARIVRRAQMRTLNAPPGSRGLTAYSCWGRHCTSLRSLPCGSEICLIGGKMTLYKWHEPYQAALAEVHTEKLKEKIDIAESVIFARLQELAGDSDHAEERLRLEWK